MKKLIIVFIVIFSLYVLPLKTIDVFATSFRGSYLRVIDYKTPFYRNPYESTPLFYLPYTYYVKILNKDQNFYHVECYGNGNTPLIDGYVPESLLFNDGLSVTDPYLNLSVTTAMTTPFYSDSSLTNRMQYIFRDRTLCYYGHFEYNGKIIYYVGYNDKLGYVEENCLLPFTIAAHPNELTFLVPETTPSQPENDEETQSSSQAFTLKIVIISCLIFAGIIALVFVLKNANTTQSTAEYYDQNEFE